MRRKIASSISLALLAGILAGPAASAQEPRSSVTDLPILSKETPRGETTSIAVTGPAPVQKTVDGNISDWVAKPSRLGGTFLYSAGELVYQDHIFDANGADDGRDASRLEKTDPVESVVPETYRLDALSQADAPGELGVPTPEEYSYDSTYGDAVEHQDAADFAEVRVAVSGETLYLLARTTTLRADDHPALVLLADTSEGSDTLSVPFNSGLTSNVAETALFITEAGITSADLASGVESPLSGTVAVNRDGYTNAVEASIPLSAVSSTDGALSIALASGLADDTGTAFRHLELEIDDVAHPNVANIAFRTDEPVRIWMDKQQALALNAGTIDPFFYAIDTAKLASGGSEEVVPGPGYHDRIFISEESTGVPRESGQDGVFQHYGLFLPTAYDGSPVPLQWWLHWRGGSAHSGAAVVPKVFKQLGEDADSIVVAPSGRGSSTWYVGKGHVDFLEVWKDVFDSVTIDRDRVYVTGHSMGGWGSYLLTLLYPDRFAAAAPFAGPVTQGAWTGADFPGCDSMKFDEYTPCYIDANGSRPRDQHTRKILENALHVPYGIFHGTDDELVPYSGVVRQTERLVELGYRYRFYTSPGYEHYSHPVMDQWSEAGRYMHQFARPENPAHVVYKRDMPFERATEEVQSGGAVLDFDFDSAYWMSELTPTDEQAGVASFDGRSLAISDEAHVVAPDSGPPASPGATGPYVITGLQWLDDPATDAPATSNAFDLSLSGTKAVRLELPRMSIDVGAPIAGSIDTTDALQLQLAGPWASVPDVAVDGWPVPATLNDGVVSFDVPAGAHQLTITPADGPTQQATVLSFTDASDPSAQYSDATTVEAQLVAGDGTPITGAPVDFSLAGAQGSRSLSSVTDEAGFAAVTFDVTERPGDHRLTATYAGTETLAPSTAGVDYVVTRDDSSLSVTESGRGANKLLTARLVDSDSADGLAGREIAFYSGDRLLGSATTNEQGVATYAPSKNSARPGSFEAVFAGDDLYRESSATS